MRKTLLVILGPTAVGKTDLCLSVAEELGIPVINADSRQIYKEMVIGTAAPTQEQQKRVQHFFVGTLSVKDYYSAARYESNALEVINKQFETSDTALLSGGSMLYIDAVCNGIDDIPTVDEITRQELKRRLNQDGLDTLRKELRLIDPQTYARIDLKNPRRIVHALEIYYCTGKPYSSFLNHSKKTRPFDIVKIGLQRERADLFSRINQRVDSMMAQGLPAEAQTLYPMRELNALQTVGYTELFHVIDGDWTEDFAVEKIKRNTRVYAKKQMTWFAKDNQIEWFHPEEDKLLRQYIQDQLASPIS